VSLAGGTTVRFTVLVVLPDTPVIVTVVLAATGTVETVKLAEVAPDGTVTLSGTVATAVLLLESDTTCPPDPAAPVSVTVPVALVPPSTLIGLMDNEERVGGGGGADTTSEAQGEKHPRVAKTATTVPVVTGEVVTGKVALVCPAGTVTLGGT
jgi:hypothetical protein